MWPDRVSNPGPLTLQLSYKILNVDFAFHIHKTVIRLKITNSRRKGKCFVHLKPKRFHQ